MGHLATRMLAMYSALQACSASLSSIKRWPPIGKLLET